MPNYTNGHTIIANPDPNAVVMVPRFAEMMKDATLKPPYSKLKVGDRVILKLHDTRNGNHGTITKVKFSSKLYKIRDPGDTVEDYIMYEGTTDDIMSYSYPIYEIRRYEANNGDLSNDPKFVEMRDNKFMINTNKFNLASANLEKNGSGGNRRRSRKHQSRRRKARSTVGRRGHKRR